MIAVCLAGISEDPVPANFVTPPTEHNWSSTALASRWEAKARDNVGISAISNMAAQSNHVT